MKEEGCDPASSLRINENHATKLPALSQVILIYHQKVTFNSNETLNKHWLLRGTERQMVRFISDFLQNNTYIIYFLLLGLAKVAVAMKNNEFKFFPDFFRQIANMSLIVKQ